MQNNVLYIEDNPDNMMLVKRALEVAGIACFRQRMALKVSKLQNPRRWI